MSTKNYFQFPIAALQIAKKPSEVTAADAELIAQRIIDHCIRAESKRLVVLGGVNEPHNEDDNGPVCAQRVDSILGDFDDDLADDWRIAISDDETDLLAGDLIASKMLDVEVPPKVNRATTQKTTGKTLVRIRTDVFLDMKDGNFPYQKFAVLAAVHGNIGTNPILAISYDHLRYCASGFSSKREFKESGCNPKYLLTYDQVRFAVDKLRANSLFFAATAGRRLYYSKRDQDIQKRVAMFVAFKEVKRKRRSGACASRAMIQHEIEALSGPENERLPQ